VILGKGSLQERTLFAGRCGGRRRWSCFTALRKEVVTEAVRFPQLDDDQRALAQIA